MIWFAVPALLSAAYWLLAVFASIKRLTGRYIPGTYTPPVSILKPIRGRDERFYEAILSHARQDYPEFEIVFGIRDPHDAAWIDVQRLTAEFPSLSIRTVTDAPETPNGKAGMLIALAREARHPTLLVNDSDILVPRNYLRAVVGPLEDPTVGLVTCLYRARGASFPAKFEALGVATDFVPSLLVARTVGVVQFALGSTMAFDAKQLRAVGGFEAIADYLADDYQLGERISKSGKRIVIAECPVETSLGDGSWLDVWKHQVRWSRTIRVSQDAGYVGSVITQALPWCLLALVAGWWKIALVSYAIRVLGGFLAARSVGATVNFALIPFRDLFGTAVWMAGLCGSHVEWRGQRLHLRRDGRIDIL